MLVLWRTANTRAALDCAPDPLRTRTDNPACCIMICSTGPAIGWLGTPQQWCSGGCRQTHTKVCMRFVTHIVSLQPFSAAGMFCPLADLRNHNTHSSCMPEENVQDPHRTRTGNSAQYHDLFTSLRQPRNSQHKKLDQNSQTAWVAATSAACLPALPARHAPTSSPSPAHLALSLPTGPHLRTCSRRVCTPRAHACMHACLAM